MAREGVSFDQVAGIADDLARAGKAATIKAVREVLGTGSPNTIHRHLAEWKAARSPVRVAEVELDAGIREAIAKQIERVAGDVARAAEDRAAGAEADLDELAAAIARLESALATMTTERDEALTAVADLKARVAEAEAEAVRQIEQTKAVQERLEKALLALGCAEVRLEGMDALRQEIAALRASLADSEERRVIAEKDSAVAVAVLATLREQIAGKPQAAAPKPDRPKKGSAPAAPQADDSAGKGSLI